MTRFDPVAFEAALRPSLLARATRDERARRRFHRAGEGAAAEAAYTAVLAVDHENQAWLEGVLRALGRWPWRSRVGGDAAHAAWLLAQHIPEDLEFQNRCLSLLGDAVAAGEAEARSWAMLADRVRVAASQPQRFGTQSVVLPGGHRRLWPLEDRLAVDAARAGVGLPPLDRPLDEAGGLALLPPP